LEQAVRICRSQLPEGSAEPTLAIVWASSRFCTAYSAILEKLKALVPSVETIVGSSGFGVIGGAEGDGLSEGPLPPEEVELVPAVSLTLAVLPGVEVTSFRVTPSTIPDADAPPDRWAELTGVPLPAPSQGEGEGAPNADEDRPHFVLFIDPSFREVQEVLQGLDFAYPESTKVGGLASSTSMQEQWCTFWSGEGQRGTCYGGMVGLALRGNGLSMQSVVAQGCRQIGDETLTITAGERNLVAEVQDGAGRTKTPLQALQEMVAALSPEDQMLAQKTIMVALTQDSLKSPEELEAGDFLIRGLQGADPERGLLAVGDSVKVGQRMRFMVRDRMGAMEDLKQHLQDYKRQELRNSFLGSETRESPFGAVLFSCNGRGTGLFSQPNFDSRTFAEYIPVNVSGVFCNGEVGQVGSSTYLHGFTAVFGIIMQRRKAPAATEA